MSGLDAAVDARATSRGESMVTTRTEPASIAYRPNHYFGKWYMVTNLKLLLGMGGDGGYVAYVDGGGNRMGLRTWGLTAVLDDSSGRSRGLLARFVGLGQGDSSSQGPTP